MKNGHAHIPEFGKKFDLRALDPGDSNGYSREEADAEILVWGFDPVSIDEWAAEVKRVPLTKDRS